MCRSIAAKQILCATGDYYIDFISCPTCARTTGDLRSWYFEENGLLAFTKHKVKIAIMGCVVNGPGDKKPI